MEQSCEAIGSGDYNGDGMADIYWRNAVTGENYIYFMNGTTVYPTEGFTGCAPPVWSIVSK